MTNNVILFGGSGNLGRKIAEELHRNNYRVTAVVRNETRTEALKQFAADFRVANVLDPAAVKGLTAGFDAVVSALGKPVSPNDRSKPSFADVDLNANSAILDDAVKTGVRKFVYVSALHAERYTHLEYFRVHHEFSERLKQSGLDYSIVKPPALFSAFVDLIDMARKGRLVTMGHGDKRTNPVYEGDLAAVCVASIRQPFTEIEAGGPEVLSRGQINAIIQSVVAPSKKVRSVPLGLVKTLLPLVKLGSRNLYDKLAFFTEVMQHDTVAPQVGRLRLEDYIREKAK